MKNIHVLPTSQPSNLLLCIKSYIEHKDTPAENSDNKGNFTLGFGIYANTEFYQHQHIYITSAEEIKVGDWYYLPRTNSVHKCIEDPTELNLEIRLGVAKIILSTDQDLIADGVQAIDDDFLEWFVNNPSCEKVEVNKMRYGYLSGFAHAGYKIIIPKEETFEEKLAKIVSKEPSKFWSESDERARIREEQKQHLIDMMKSDEELGLYEEPKQETLEELYLNQLINEISRGFLLDKKTAKEVAIKYSKWQQEQDKKMYSEEDLREAFESNYDSQNYGNSNLEDDFKEWLEQFKKK